MDQDDDPANKISSWVLRVLGAVVGLLVVAAVIGLAASLVIWGVRVSGQRGAPGLPSVLLAAASLFILIFSVIVGLGAVVGWRGLKEAAVNRVREEFQDEIADLRLDHKLSSGFTRGFMYGQMSHEKYSPGAIKGDPLQVVNHTFLENAIGAFEEALKIAPEDHDKVGVIKNNLAFLLALRKEPKDGQRARQLVEDLKEHYSDWDSPVALNTHARVVAVYAEEFDDPRAELQRAKEGLRWLLKERAVPPEEKANARRHLREVRRALTDL